MKVQQVYQDALKVQGRVNDHDADRLIRAANRDNEAASGCCSGPTSDGDKSLKQIYETSDKFEIAAKSKIFQYLNGRGMLTEANAKGGIVKK